MAEWNLSVELRGQGSSLTRSLRQAAGEARTLARDVRTAQGALDRLGRRAQATSRDLARLERQAVATAASLRGLTAAARSTNRALGGISARTRTLGEDVTALTTASRSAGRSVNRLGAASDTTGERFTTLTTRSQTLRGELDALGGSLTHVRGGLRDTRGSLNQAAQPTKTTADLFGKVKAAAISLLPALLPIAASVAPLALSMSAAATSTAVWGAAIAGQITQISEAADAQDKWDKAVREHGQLSEQAITAQIQYQALLTKMPAASQQATVALATLKSAFTAWSDSLASSTMPAVTKSFQLLGSILPGLSPMAKAAGTQMDRLITVLGGATQTEQFTAFMTRFTEFADVSLTKATTAAIRFATSLDTDKIGANVREFMDYARANGPLVADTLTHLTAALLHLLVAGSDVGVSMLQVVNVLARLVSAIPTSVLATVMQLYTAFKLVAVGMGAVNAVVASGAIARLSAYFAVMRAAGVSTTLRATAGSMSGMQKAATGLGVLGLAAIGIDMLAKKARGAPPDIDRLTTSLKNLSQTGKFTGELSKTFGDIDGLVAKLNKLDHAQRRMNQNSFDSFRIPVFDDAMDWLAKSADDLARGSDSFEALRDDFESVDAAMAGMVQAGHAKQAADDFGMFSTRLHGVGKSTEDINKVFPKYRDAVASLKAEQDLAAAGMGLFGKESIATKAKLDEQKASADGLRQSLQALNDAQRTGLGGMIGFEAAIDAATKAAKDNAGALSMKNGALDLNSEKARNAATALNDLAAKTDEATASARQSGASWETVNGIYERGRKALIATAQQMGLNAGQATELAESILQIPDEKATLVEMRREDALAGLQQVADKLRATPGAKSITLSALTSDAVAHLEYLGFKVTTMPDGHVSVQIPTGPPKSAIDAIQYAINNMSGTTIGIGVYTTEYYKKVQQGPKLLGITKADGGTVDYYANGGMRRENHTAQIAPKGAWRVWAEDETGGEAYIPLAPGKRPRSRAIAEETVRRLGGTGVQWNADGNVTDWRYDPQTGSLYSASDAGQAGHKTRKVKVKDKHGKVTIKEIEYFDLTAVEKQIRSTAAATRSWNKDLEKVADRVGGDVADALAAMGEDGMKLAHKMATGSTKYINDMAKALRDLKKTAYASLSDYTRQLSSANKMNKTFADNLTKLAAEGYGDLAKQLAAQNDTAAQQLAATAVKDKKKAGSANTAAKNANSALTADQVQELVAIIAAVSSSKTGIHDVAATTGLGEDDIIEIASKAGGQIKRSLGGRATRFLADLSRARLGLAYANGGIREGIYATQGGAVTFAEPATGGEAYIPLGANKRRPATNVLADVAGRFGLGLTDARSGHVVVIREQAPLVGEQHWHIADTPRARDLVRKIDDNNAYQLRRLARGGAGAR